MPAHYTTLTVEEYNNLQNTIIKLRWVVQKAREALEARDLEKALNLLKTNS